MNPIQYQETNSQSSNGNSIRLVYDQETDILEIFFGNNEPATGIELTDHILLRINQKTKRAISLTLLDFSILTEQTEYGPRSFPIDRLDELPPDLQELMLQLLTSTPVNQFLKISHIQTSPTERMLFTWLEPQPLLAA